MAIGGVLNEVWMLSATRMPNKVGSMWKVFTSGRKIGTKMMMISVHSSGQPSRKMMNWARIRKPVRVQIRGKNPMLDHLVAAEIGEHRGEGPRADEQIADHRRGAGGQIDGLLQPLEGERAIAGGEHEEPSAPTAAASDGVARPNRMAPSTERIRIASGKNEVSSAQKTSLNGISTLAFLRRFGASFGLISTRTIT